MAVVFDASVLIDLFNKKLSGDRRARLDHLVASFSLEPFDQRAAFECALLLEEAWARGQQGKVSHTKFKFDWQIVAIAASRNATAIYSDDSDISKAAGRVRIPVYRTDSLPIPTSALQRDIAFDDADDEGAD